MTVFRMLSSANHHLRNKLWSSWRMKALNLSVSTVPVGFGSTLSSRNWVGTCLLLNVTVRATTALWWHELGIVRDNASWKSLGGSFIEFGAPIGGILKSRKRRRFVLQLR